LAFEDELEIDEAHVATAPGADYESVLLGNRAGVDVDESRLREELGRLAHADAVRSLVVEPSSRVTSLRFLAAFPALETLELYGLRLRTLDGLEGFTRGRYLKLDTGRNRERDIARLADAPITTLSLAWANPGDLAAIAGCTALRELALAACPPLRLEPWSEVPLESIALGAGAFGELADTAQIPTLRRMNLDRCRRFERFAGDNGGIEWMVVQRCDRLDFATLRTCPNLEFLSVVAIKPELRLSRFASLPRLRSLSLQNCNVTLDALDTAPSLEELVITDLPDAAAARLSAANAGVVVSTGQASYVDGERR
jgi:hypothetical protein